jgi:hypothetical protein
MQNNETLTPYERWHLQKFGGMPNESNTIQEAEDFENRMLEHEWQKNYEEQMAEWHNEQSF